VASNELIEEELRTLEFKLGQLRRDYDQYFLGNRPREPGQLRSEVNKSVIRLSSTAIQNTALRFKFSSLCSRFQACRRQWDETLRKIESGTYERHRFRAKMHEKAAPAAGAPRGGSRAEGGSGGGDLFQRYVDARRACGESVEGFTRAKLERVIEKQRQQLAAKFGPDADVSFRVEVSRGKARLKAVRRKTG
jgi:hypothetical protein